MAKTKKLSEDDWILVFLGVGLVLMLAFMYYMENVVYNPDSCEQTCYRDAAESCGYSLYNNQSFLDEESTKCIKERCEKT